MRPKAEWAIDSQPIRARGIIVKYPPRLGGEYKAEQSRCRELSVLPKFHSKAFLKVQEYPSVDDFEGKKDFMVFKQRDLL